jgi:O-antigen/teichoic acid export membrane protein
MGAGALTREAQVRSPLVREKQPLRARHEPTPPDDEVREFQPPSIAAGGFEALLARGGVVISQLVMIILTGRFMGPSGRGLYALASLSIGLCQVPFGSVWVANAVELAKRRATPRQIFGVSIVIAFVAGTLTAAVAVAISPALGDRWWVLALPALVTPFVLLRAYQEGIYQSLGHVRAVNALRIGRSVLAVVFITPPILADASSRTTIVIWELSFVMLCITAYFRLRSFMGTPRFPRDRALYRRVTRYGLTISGFRIIEVLNERNGLIALAIFTNDATVGVFSIAVAATEVLLMSTDALQLSTFKRIGWDARAESAALAVRTTRHCILLAAGGAALVIPIGYFAIPWILGSGYDGVSVLLLLLLPNVLCQAAMRPLYSFFQVQAEKPGKMVRIVAYALAANVVMNLALVPHWHANGAAVAASLAGIVAILVAYRAFSAETHARLPDLWPRRADVMDYVWLARSLVRRGA